MKLEVTEENWAGGVKNKKHFSSRVVVNIWSKVKEVNFNYTGKLKGLYN